MRFFFLCGLVLASVTSLFAQDVQVNRQNKTIAVTADDSVTADAEVATLEIGYHNYAATQDVAFHDNARVAEQITKALLDANVPEANIETEKLRLTRTESAEIWTPEMKKERQFEATQSWHVTVSAKNAQRVVELAIKAGANEVDDVEWNVVDPIALQARAGSAALAKARAVADQMAKGLGTKLGEPLFASNRAPIAGTLNGMRGTATVEVAEKIVAPLPSHLILFPEKVKAEATVYAVFSIE
jgi:uncharacterized protein